MTALMFILGLAALVMGAELLVRGAGRLATTVGISPLVVGLTVVAFGTSAPEIAVSVNAALSGNTDLAVGNVVGSNLLNQLVILGVCAPVSGARGLAVDPVMIQRDLPIMVHTTLACLPIFWTRGVITRLEGGLLVVLYLAYLVEQHLVKLAPGSTNEFRLLVLVVLVPAVLVFLAWQVLAWRQHRRRTA